ncbi:MAG: type IX secretion system sortase PorU [Bergeyella sp.]
MNRFLGIILLFLFSATYAQNVKIDWQGSTTIDYGTEKTVIPFFTNAGYSYQNGVVYFSMENKNSDKLMKAQNLVWEKITKKDFFDINPYLLPAKDDFSASSYYNKYDNSTSSSISVAALKMDNNEVYRLVSFEIVPETNLKQKAVQRAGTTENPLKSGNIYKIKVDKSGIFKITSNFLRSIGITPSSVNPQNMRIYGNGGLMLPEFNTDFRFSAVQENAIQVSGEEDGVWNEEDYALFYAQGPHGYNLYDYSNGDGYKRTETRTDQSNNFTNIYEDYSYYFITFDHGEGKRVQEEDVPLASQVFTKYDAYQVLNEEKLNLMKFGRIWTGDSFTTNQDITFNLNTAIETADIIKFRANIISYNALNDKVTFSINGQRNTTTSVNSEEAYSTLFYNGNISNLSGNQLTISINPDISVNPNGKFYLNYAEVQYREALNYNGQQMNFREYSILEGSGLGYAFSISNASGMEQVWDVSDVTNAKRKVNKSGSGSVFSFGYTASSEIFNNEFVAFNHSSAYTPGYVGKIENQDLAGLQNIDYLMITSPEFLGQAQRLADYYQGKYNVAVVDVNKIYNEFSSGSKDITAIRDFTTKLNTPSGTLKYIFILGDTSYDFRGRVVPGADIIPLYQSEESGSLERSYITDDYYGMTKPQTSARLWDILPDIPVGRLPAASAAEAKLLIDKTLAYNNSLTGQSTPFGEWRMKLDFVVDDDYGATTPFHTTVNNALITNFESGSTRKEYNIKKLYLDSFPAQIAAGGQRYSQVNQAIMNDMGNSLFMFYFGHGGTNGWAQERVLTLDEIQNFSNYNNIYSRFPLVSTITCEFTLWDDPKTSSSGEQLIKSSQGGAATLITSSRKIGVTYGEKMTTIFINNIFALENDEFLNLGDAFLKAKISYGKEINHLRVNFLGDPAGKLSRPKRQLVINEVESPVPGQIRALDFIKVKGQVNKADGTLDEGFSGRVVINIFDKKLTKTTLNNDSDPKMLPKLTYQEEGSPIVKASGTVVNGIFTVEFYVPKDINYEIGEGRILAYADNKVRDVFNNQVQNVGGINPDGINDDTPPVAKLYMNNTNFADGGITDQNPMLLACVTDDKGINSTGSGIGHDITTYLDGEIINTVVLNNFYFSGEGNGCSNPNLADYQKGVVTYPFKNLTPGEHQLTFKIWDINNNSTTETLNFIVKDETEQNLIINRLLNWPNPFTDKTYVQFEHNCDDILDVNVQIFTITGRLVRTISTSVTAEPFLEGYRTPRTAIEWDGKDDYGDTVGKGTYIFKIFAKSQNQEKCKGSAVAVEKMVLLK